MDIIDGYITPDSWERLALDLRARQREQLREINILLEVSHEATADRDSDGDVVVREVQAVQD